jgi:CDP-paratose 2-epimerase
MLPQNMKTLLVTGGCGFIGSNVTRYMLERGWSVRVFDSFARPGAVKNRGGLERLAGSGPLEIVEGDTRDAKAVRTVVQGVDAIVHLAAQVAVTSSVEDPRHDFEVNALGTFNVLEAARASERKPAILFTSTNKVYGGMEDVSVVERDGRYAMADLPGGVTEARALDFHSPYGCSKGSADQYVRDYSRIYGVPSIVFRMSCIYGPHQYGTEDQGWLAHFAIAALQKRPITIYGDGKQVRDVLYVDDLSRAIESALEKRAGLSGEIINIGGGPRNTLAVWSEFGPMLEQLVKRPLAVTYGDWRAGDQKVYVSNIEKAKRVLAWEPQVGPREGVAKMFEWLTANA